MQRQDNINTVSSATSYSNSIKFSPYSQSNMSIERDKTRSTSNNKRTKTTVPYPFGKCRICHDNATGVHYGVVTCEGCKGFFKRGILQGAPYRCFFGDQCVINTETRNRCKACRFKRCLDQGMAVESVKMGRIPKKIKEKAVREYQRQQNRPNNSEIIQESQRNMHDNDDLILINDDNDESDDDETEIEEVSLSHPLRDSMSSSSPHSSTESSERYSTSESISQSNDTTPEIFIIPSEVLAPSPLPIFRTADLIELTISSSNTYVNNMNPNLSLLSLPPIFHQSYPLSISSENVPVIESDHRQHPVEFRENLAFNNTDIQLTCMTNRKKPITVTQYIAKLNQTALVDYMFNCELRYSKNVLQIMKYLAPKLSQPFLVYELDFEVTSFFRFIRWKMLNFYLKYTTRIRSLVKRMFGIIKLGITEYPGLNASPHQMWDGIQSSIAVYIKELIGFSQDMPGINELNKNDFTRLMNTRVFDFWMIHYYPLFYQNESYIMLLNGLQYTRQFMNLFIGKQTTDEIHLFCERLQALNVTQVEHSLIYPIVMCRSDDQLYDCQSVHIIQYCYLYALYIQMCTTRTEDEAKILFDSVLRIIDDISVINELCQKHIGTIPVGEWLSR